MFSRTVALANQSNGCLYSVLRFQAIAGVGLVTRQFVSGHQELSEIQLLVLFTDIIMF